MATEYIRVKNKATGHEHTIPKGRFNEDAHDVVDKPALGPDGTPAPVKYRTKLGSPRTGSKQARKRTAKKAAAKTAASSTPETPPAAEPGNSDGQSAGTAEEN